MKMRSLIPLCIALFVGSATIVRAELNDYQICVAEDYSRVKTDAERAGTIGACSRVLVDPSTNPEQLARAHYFRGLNHFLDSVRLAFAEMKPIGSAGEVSQAALASAMEDLAACIAAAPQPSPFPFSLRATIYTTLEKYDLAMADLAQAIRADPKSSTHYVQRALILERLDRFAEARADLDNALTLDPKNQNAWNSRARLWTRYGDVNQAIADYNQAEMVGGTQTWDALNGRAKLQVRLGEPERALEDWTKAAELSPLPTLAAQFFTRAGNLARDYLKDMNKAIRSYDRAFATIPNYTDAFIQRGILQERAGKLAEAQRDYRKAVDATAGNLIDKTLHDYAQFRLNVLPSRQSRKAGDPQLPPNINVLTRSANAKSKPEDRKIALVIGNAAYAHVPALMNADRDAESVGGALSEAGFSSVTVATDLDRKQLEGVLKQFARDVAGVDWAIIYYAGHGIEAQGQNYLIPIDVTLQALRGDKLQMVPLTQALDAVGSAERLRFIALDACRDNPFVQEAHRIASLTDTAGHNASTTDLDSTIVQKKDIGGGFAGMQISVPNTIVLYSTQPGQVALDGDELNSPFTRAFLKNIPVPGQDFLGFLDRVREDVANVTQRRQQPAILGRLQEGDRFFFFPVQSTIR